MRKKKIYFGLFTGVILVMIIILFQSNNIEIEQEQLPTRVKADVIMPTKVSRPGCEETNSCYVPSLIVIEKGQQVTWSNEDVAFHSVTSGIYGEPSNLFDSGHLDPEQQYGVTFENNGTFDYFCTLHPWMKGQVTVG